VVGAVGEESSDTGTVLTPLLCANPSASCVASASRMRLMRCSIAPGSLAFERTCRYLDGGGAAMARLVSFNREHLAIVGAMLHTLDFGATSTLLPNTASTRACRLLITRAPMIAG
jgi:hypothetical protein